MTCTVFFIHYHVNFVFSTYVSICTADAATDFKLIILKELAEK